MNVQLTWATPNAEEMITHMARVSAPKNQGNMETAPKLLKYLITHKHWSPYEMANMCVEINTTRAISAQIIRHRSFSFQEFSQRYADTNE
jgi:thymidylate synthase (FAD)